MMDIDKDVLQKLSELHGEKVRFLGVELVKKPAPNKGSYKVLKLVCAKHGEGEQRQDVALKGSLPKCCVGSRIGASKRPDFYSNVEKLDKIHSNKYVYLKFSYGLAGQQRVTYLCPEHGLVEQLLSNHSAGKGCNRCACESRGKASRATQEDSETRAKTVHKSHYTYLPNVFEMGETWMQPVCPTHGAFKQRLYDHLNGKGCSKCQPPVSKVASEFLDAVESLGITIEREKKIGRYSVDGYVAQSNIAIEFDGLWFHSDAFRPDFAMARKQAYLQSQGVRSIHILEDEWVNKPQVVLSLLRSVCLNSQGLAARKTQASKIDWQTAKEFLNKNHIQGAPKYGDSYGLFYESKLVAVATFSRSTSDRRAKKSQSHAELVRFASNQRVVGGLSKLLAFYLKNEPEILTVVSFSDNRLFSGGAYAATGFKKVRSYSMDYYYVKGSRRYLKSAFQKAKLLALFPDLPKDLTEREMALLKGYRRLYDSGKTKWLYVKKPT